jgi:uncharacterized protein (TIGR00255 family)
MVLSMTGFGNAVLETPDLLIRVEIKSLNSRGLDLSIRVPRSHAEKEITLRSQLTHRFQRGKVSVYVDTEATGSRVVKKAINWDLLIEYYKELKHKAEEVGAPVENLLPSLLNVSDILQPQSIEPSEDNDWPLIENALNQALDKFDEFRKTEGEALHKELIQYINNIGDYLEKVVPLKDKRVEKIKADLREKLMMMQEEGRLDENRFEQELIYFAEKLDITEEIVRLSAHLKYFLETLNEPAPGKKLGFISQEIGREINTIGSKANDASIQKDIVLMKEELEKIKEQCLNVL